MRVSRKLAQWAWMGGLVALSTIAHAQDSNDPTKSEAVYLVIDGVSYKAPAETLKAIRTAGEVVLEVSDPTLGNDPPRYLVLTKVQK